MQTLLVNSGLFTATSCVVSQEAQPWTSPAPPCCWIQVNGFNPDQGIAIGLGRYFPVQEGEYTVNLVLRRTRDVDQQDTQLLTNVAGGLPLVDQVINVLLEQLLFDTLGNQLTSQTLKLGGIGVTRNYGQRRDLAMAVVPLTFRARLMLQPNVPDYGG
jgi:hypothetical protein